MQNSLILQDKNYISAKQVQDLFGYTSDYVGQLCRAGKLDSKMIGRSWFVTEKSIKEYKTSVIDLIRQKNTQKKNVAKADYKTESQKEFQKIYKEELQKKSDEQKLEAQIQTEKTRESYSPLKSEPEKLNPIPVLINQLGKINKFKEDNKKINKNINKEATASIESPFLMDLSSSEKSKFVFATLATVAVVIFFIYGYVKPINVSNISKIQSSTSSVASSISPEIVESIISGFRNISLRVAGMFGRSSHLSVAPPETPTSDSSLSGIAVVPSTNSSSKDEMVKQKIRDTFSDEVKVSPDVSGTAGIITPVFRKTNGDDFVYVLVPLNNKDSNKDAK